MRNLNAWVLTATLLLAAPVTEAALIVCSVHGQYLAFFPGDSIGNARTLARNETPSCREVVSCPTPGWFAVARSRSEAGRWTGHLGLACGYADRDGAEAKASRECAAQGGADCAIWRVGEDDASEAVFDTGREMFCAVRDSACETL
jgi:hypothetical protein